MTTLNVSISSRMKQKLKASAAKKGFASTSDYVRAILESAETRGVLAMQEMLAERLRDSKTVAMDSDDWKRIRSAVRSQVRLNK